MTTVVHWYWKEITSYSWVVKGMVSSNCTLTIIFISVLEMLLEHHYKEHHYMPPTPSHYMCQHLRNCNVADELNFIILWVVIGQSTLIYANMLEVEVRTRTMVVRQSTNGTPATMPCTAAAN